LFQNQTYHAKQLGVPFHTPLEEEALC